MTTTTLAPAALAVDPSALADVTNALRRDGAQLEDLAVLRAPDTGATTFLTAAAWRRLAAEVERAAIDLQLLGDRLAAFVELVADVDDRTRAEIDRTRGGALW